MGMNLPHKAGSPALSHGIPERVGLASYASAWYITHPVLSRVLALLWGSGLLCERITAIAFHRINALSIFRGYTDTLSIVPWNIST